jgi:SAM-dependent methyltransferase
MQDSPTYFQYLKNRSQAGLIYRKFWLYPRLNGCLIGKTLDIGCGIGDFLSYRDDIVGVDINIKMVEWCRSQGQQVEKMKVDELPFKDGSYDSIIMDNVLEHIKNPEKILREAYRVLRSNGVFLLGVPGSYGYTKDSDHKVFYSEERLIQTLEINGFAKQEIFSMPFNLKLLEKYLSQYCVYGVFLRKD